MGLLGFTITREKRAIVPPLDAVEAAIHALARRVNALELAAERCERELEAARLQRADWLERIERLYARVRVRQDRAKNAEETSDTGDLAAIRARRNR